MVIQQHITENTPQKIEISNSDILLKHNLQLATFVRFITVHRKQNKKLRVKRKFSVHHSHKIITYAYYIFHTF